MQDNINIAMADARDADTLFQMLQHQFSEHQIALDADRLLSAIHHLISNRALGFALMAREGDVPVGLAVISLAWTLEHGGRSAWLDELYVVPHKRSRGIGRLLIEKVIEMAKEQGCLDLDLEVDIDHRRAEKLYEQSGFSRLDRSRWVRRL
jgi:GNAT superfamily N-acetyltransferase